METPLELPFPPLLALLLGGFLVGIFGHLIQSRVVVAVGIGLILLATVLLPLVYATGGG